MSDTPMSCENCGSEWFTVQERVKIGRFPFVPGGVPWHSETKRHYVCVDCGRVFDESRLHVGKVSA